MIPPFLTWMMHAVTSFFAALLVLFAFGFWAHLWRQVLGWLCQPG